MKELIHLFGVVLAGGALNLLLVGVAAINQQGDSALWFGGELLCLGIAALIVSVLFLRKTMAIALGQCPKCGQTEYRSLHKTGASRGVRQG